MYGSIMAVMGALRDQLQSASPSSGFIVQFNGNTFKIIISATTGTFSIGWTDPDLASMLGYRTSIPTGSGATANDNPEYAWLPTYYSFDDQRFITVFPDMFRGSRSGAGRISGVRLTQEQYRRVFKWDAEPAENVFIEAGTTQFDLGGNTYKPQQRRCWQQFITDVLTASPTKTTSGNLNPKGIYYIHDYTLYTSSTNYPDDPGSGGINFHLDSGTLDADTYVYCTPPVTGSPPPDPRERTGKRYYSVEIELTTATAPDWNRP
jgi:hypothetical protein